MLPILASIWFLYATNMDGPPLMVPNLTENECKAMADSIPSFDKYPAEVCINGCQMPPGTYMTVTCKEVP